MEMTWLDSLVSSVAYNFHSDTARTGIFLHLPAQDMFQPSVEWFCHYNVPVWYAWGQEQARDQRFSSIAPLTHQLQLGTTTLLQNPSDRESGAADNIAPAAQDPSAREPAAADDTGEIFLPPWKEFFASRHALNERLETTETGIGQTEAVVQRE